MQCRHCRSTETSVVVDLGSMPASNSFLKERGAETHYPLKVFVCQKCFLVQIEECKKADEIFKEDYVYHSSQSPANVSHAKEYAEMMCNRFGYTKGSNVLEIGSNDGYMLQWFVKKGCKVLGVDPAKSAVDIALSKGVASLPVFFNAKMAEKFEGAFDLICNINTLAHQPDLNDFVRGMKIALAPGGVITCEFPHLVNLIDGLQYDTIYHEHYSYFSLLALQNIFHTFGLYIFDVDTMPEHGGSLRIYACHMGARLMGQDPFKRIMAIVFKERNKVDNLDYYADFQKRCEATKTDVLEFLRTHRSVGAYGAAAKGNTFLNYCGITPEMLPYVVDRSPIKQGMYLPGSQIQVVDENVLRAHKPEYILILAWNLRDEIMEQLSYAKDWGGRFVVAIPELEIL